MDTSPQGARAFRHADCIDRAHPQRAEVEAFIHAIYAARFDARPPALMPHLLAFRDADGELLAAVGLRCAIEGPLFVERYLGAPVERVLAERLGHAPPRAEVVEIGNFAAATPGAARALILALIPLLRGAGLRWTLFAATRQLRNAFARLGLDPRFLCRAQAEALGSEGEAWGRYYETDPEVLFGDLEGARVGVGEYAASKPARDVPVVARAALGCEAPA
ncbi:thermostable hemolysin [Aquimonas voraii]|uniref:Thermostable hemolysin n=1 Tax=Aquimonas voraii TaxID=265719 RepID=A0A1G6XDE5_9GAMM|nr:thermostable hemolysin [Aquimonas voraii]SDD75325.1 Thermostable hemolysin [Aquimonas voraii]